MEYAKQGDVDNLITRHKTANKPIDQKEIWNIVTCSKVYVIYTNKISSTETLNQLLLVCKDMNVKLGDLNVSKMLKNMSKREFNIIKQIGKGSYSTVHKVRRIEDNSK